MQLTPETIQAINDSFVSTLKREGLVLVPETVARFSNEYYLKRKQAFKKIAVSPQTIVKYDMLNGVKAVRTIKNMVADGRIGHSEHYKDGSGNLKILVIAIKRINNQNPKL